MRAGAEPFPTTWANFTQEHKRKWLDWIVATCLLHGTTLYTAYSVAALFGGGLDAEQRDIGPNGPVNE